MEVFSVTDELFHDNGKIPVGSLLIMDKKITYSQYSGISGTLYTPKDEDTMSDAEPEVTEQKNVCILEQYLHKLYPEDFTSSTITPGDIASLQVELPPIPMIRKEITIGTKGIIFRLRQVNFVDVPVVLFNLEGKLYVETVRVGDLDVLCRMGLVAERLLSSKPAVEPKNNDGREACFWCHSKTDLVDSGMSFYNVCPTCKK